VRVLTAVLLLALVASDALAESAASEHKEKWDALRDRGESAEKKDEAAEESRKEAPGADAARPKSDEQGAEQE
jgi:hypothetical protein